MNELGAINSSFRHGVTYWVQACHTHRCGTAIKEHHSIKNMISFALISACLCAFQNTVSFFEDLNYGGQRFDQFPKIEKTGSSCVNINQEFNDKATSLFMWCNEGGDQPHLSICVYDDINCGGDFKCFSGCPVGVQNFGDYNLNDRVSSFKVLQLE